MIYAKRRNQRGATLLEALAFLGIAAIVIVGAISMFRSAQGSAQASKMIAELNGLRSAVKTLYSSQSAYHNGTPSVFPATLGTGLSRILLRAGALPDGLNTLLGVNIRNQFGGGTNVYGDDSTFWIMYTNVPQEVCLKVAPQIGGSWMGLLINPAMGNSFVDTDVQSFPVAIADAQCTSGNSNTMIFRSR